MELEAGELQWRSVKLTGSAETVAAFESILSPEEIERCRRFYYEVHRRDFALSHGVLRILLSQHLRISPQEITFQYGPAGKPSLDAAAGNLEFNMSHSRDLAVYGFARGCRLGVDVEQVRPMADLERVAAHFFSREECGDLLALSADERTEAFFRCWTRKEAFIKALGQGISMSLQSFRVSLLPGEPAALLHTEKEADHEWHMHHFTPDADFFGAAVYDGDPRRVREWPLVEAAEILRRFEADHRKSGMSFTGGGSGSDCRNA